MQLELNALGGSPTTQQALVLALKQALKLQVRWHKELGTCNVGRAGHKAGSACVPVIAANTVQCSAVLNVCYCTRCKVASAASLQRLQAEACGLQPVALFACGAHSGCTCCLP